MIFFIRVNLSKEFFMGKDNSLLKINVLLGVGILAKSCMEDNNPKNFILSMMVNIKIVNFMVKENLNLPNHFFKETFIKELNKVTVYL